MTIIPAIHTLALGALVVAAPVPNVSDVVVALRANPDSFVVQHLATPAERRLYAARVGTCVVPVDGLDALANESVVHLAEGWFAHSGRTLFYRGECVVGGEGQQTLLFHPLATGVGVRELCPGRIAGIGSRNGASVLLTIREEGCCDDRGAAISVVNLPLVWGQSIRRPACAS